MKLLRPCIYLIALLAWTSQPAAAASFPGITVYANTFDSAASLNGFTQLGDGSLSVVGGQLQASINNPFGRVDAMLNTSASFSSPYNSTLALNQGLVTWGFNVSNQDNGPNNEFHVILASTHADPYTYTPTQAQGYIFRGGGALGSQMALWRFNYGIGGGQDALIDLPSGLSTLPQMGSFRITYNPTNNLWSLYGSTGTSYTDPMSITTLLGSATDSMYTSTPAPYFGLGGLAGGTDYFDNVTVTVVPEPTTASLLLGGVLVGVAMARRRIPHG